MATPERAAFVLLPEQVRSFSYRTEKDGRGAHWLEPLAYDQKAFREAWERIGNG